MITVLGSINLDLVASVERLPRPGETVPGFGFSTTPGGKGANQAVAARRAGGGVRMVGAAGRDQMGDQAVEILASEGVDLTLVRRIATNQGIAVILVDRNGENAIGIVPGANATLGPDDVERAMKGSSDADTIVLQQEIPQSVTTFALERARSLGLRTILNTAPFLDTTSEIAPLASILISNESEFSRLSGTQPEDWRQALEQWSSAHGQTIIVTRGPYGAVASTAEGILEVPALPVEVVDTVGAGDTFVGYLAAGLDQGLSLEPAMRRAAVAASLACRRAGAQAAMPEQQEVERAVAD